MFRWVCTLFLLTISNYTISAAPFNKVTADYDTLMCYAMEVFHGDISHQEAISEGKTLYESGNRESSAISGLYGSAIAGIGYLYDNDIDSCLFYLNKCIYINEHIDERTSSQRKWVMAVVYNALGLCYINLTVDYYQAVVCFTYALKEMDRYKEDSPALYTTILANMTLVHYFMNDSTGYRYAQECYDFAREHKISAFAANYSMALMEYLNQRYQSAENYIEYALETIRRVLNPTSDTYNKYISAYSVYGKILLAQGREDEALEILAKATELTGESSESDIASVYMIYGEYYMLEKNYTKAIELLQKGINESLKVNNYIHLPSLYKLTSQAYKEIGEYRKAFEYISMYDSVSTSIYAKANEFALIQAKTKYRLEQYENQIKDKQITILKKQKQNNFLLFMVILSFTVIVFVLYMYRQMNRYYKKMVEHYQDKMNISRQMYCNSPLSENKGNELYNRVNRMMEEENIYRDPDLSIDKLASMLGTNRSYLSRVINEHSGVNFNKFINRLRIRDAVQMLSDIHSSSSIKQIAVDTGFNSQSTFSRVFAEETGVFPSVYKRNIDKIHSSNHQYTN